MPNFLKILNQTSSFTKRRRGYYRNPIYRVSKEIVDAANYITGTRATYAETETEISGDMFPYDQKRWTRFATDIEADFVLVTNERLTYDASDDSRCDEIEYKNNRYRIVRILHHERLAYSDMFQYGIRLADLHTPAVPVAEFLLQENGDYLLQENDDRIELD